MKRVMLPAMSLVLLKLTAMSQHLITHIRDDACDAYGHVSCFDNNHKR